MLDTSVLLISKCRKFARLPTRGTPKSAGIDLYIPEIDLKSEKDDYNRFCRDFYFHNGYDTMEMTRLFPENKEIVIYPHGKVLIPIGIRIKVPEGSALIAFNKSGTSFKQSVARLACVIDEDFQGEIMVTLQNYSSVPISLRLGQKIVQLVRVPVFYDAIQEVDNATIFPEVSERAEGSLGSTGIN
jgi:dUTP pyrophosphatase